MKLPFGGRKQPAPVPRRRLSDQPPRDDSTATGVGSTAQGSSTFRRNQTLTGTTSHTVRASTELSGQMQSPRATAHHLRRRRRHLSGLLVIGLVGIVLLGGMLQQLTAEVRVSVVGQVRPLTQSQQDRIVEPIESYLAMRPIERIRAFMNHDNLTAYLQSEGVRDIEYVSDVRGDGIGRSVVQLKVREPVARWSIAGQERFVDKSGAVFAVNYFDTPTVAIRDESGISTRSESEAQAVTSGRFLAFVGQSVGLLDNYGLQVNAVVIPPATTRQVNLVVAGDREVPVKMIIDRPAGEQSEDAARAYNHLAGQGQPPQYIDVRVSGMAYYRQLSR